jgi:hypothetical protein
MLSRRWAVDWECLVASAYLKERVYSEEFGNSQFLISDFWYLISVGFWMVDFEGDRRLKK